MRDAPDARVILEVALVRLVRPELDDDGPALVERLARLERAVAAVSRAHRFLPLPHREPAAPAARRARSRRAGPRRPPAQGEERARRADERAHGQRAAAARPDQVPASDPAPATAGQLPSRDDLVEAWGDTSSGGSAHAPRHCSSPGASSRSTTRGGVRLPNAAHLEHAKDSTKAVEAALESTSGSGSPSDWSSTRTGRLHRPFAVTGTVGDAAHR